MKIDTLKNSGIVLDVTGCTWIEFDSWTASGSRTSDDYTYYANGKIQVYDYATSTATDILVTEDGYEAIVSSRSNSSKSLSKQKINVKDVEYIKISSGFSVGSTTYGTVIMEGLKGY